MKLLYLLSRLGLQCCEVVGYAVWSSKLFRRSCQSFQTKPKSSCAWPRTVFLSGKSCCLLNDCCLRGFLAPPFVCNDATIWLLLLACHFAKNHLQKFSGDMFGLLSAPCRLKNFAKQLPVSLVHADDQADAASKVCAFQMEEFYEFKNSTNLMSGQVQIKMRLHSYVKFSLVTKKIQIQGKIYTSIQNQLSI